MIITNETHWKRKYEVFLFTPLHMDGTDTNRSVSLAIFIPYGAGNNMSEN